MLIMTQRQKISGKMSSVAIKITTGIKNVNYAGEYKTKQDGKGFAQTIHLPDIGIQGV